MQPVHLHGMVAALVALVAPSWYSVVHAASTIDCVEDEQMFGSNFCFGGAAPTTCDELVSTWSVQHVQ